MRNVLKASTLERKLPIKCVENDCIITKDADITVAFRVTLPELFTLTSEDYESIHTTWVKAIKVLPDYCILHKQDWFTEEKYAPEIQKDDLSFLSRAYENHFNERPYLEHTCNLFLTKTTKERNRQLSTFNALSRNFIVPKELNKETLVKFIESVEQFQNIVNESGFITLTRLYSDDIIGTKEFPGIVEKYFSLSQKDTTSLKDITIYPHEMKIGDDILCLHTLSDTDDLMERIKTDMRYEKLSLDRIDCRLSFAAPVGLLLPCNHIYNQYIFLDEVSENLKSFEKTAKNMYSLSKYSRANEVNRLWIEEYLNEAHMKGLTSIRCHCNVLAWSDNREKLKRIKNETGSQIALMECKPRYNTTDCPTLFWAGIPGNSADFPYEESFYTYVEQAVAFFTEETNYRDSLSPFGIKMADRFGKPLHLDISDMPMKLGWTTNRNKFILGPSGSGKSFFTNHLVRQYWEQGTHILLIDTGNSYQGLCNLIHAKTHGKDGVYFTYTPESPITFNPFYSENGFDIEKKESIKTLILTLWKREDEPPSRSEEVALSDAVNLYINKLQSRDCKPGFNTFYEFVRSEYRDILQKKEVREKDFDIMNFLNVLAPFYRGGEYDYLLNSDKQLDLLNKRFIVFELDTIKDHKVLFPVVTLIIMETFINKMRSLKGIRKMILIEEAWKALTKGGMAEYIRYLFKTVRKYFGEACVVTQELDDIIGNVVVKDAIINNSDCKILLDTKKYMNRFEQIQNLLGLTDKERSQILSINLSNNPNRKYKEVWISTGSHSAVYATEVSLEEYYAYTTEESEKVELFNLAEKLGGNLELAIKQLAASKREK